MSQNYWETELSYITPDEIRIRGYSLVDMIGTKPFPEVLYLLYTGELPSPEIGRLLDAVMVASIDHGAGAPSALAARTAASGGAPLGSAAAAGLLTIGRFHGAAVQDSMEAIKAVVEEYNPTNELDSLADAAKKVVTEWRNEKRRVSGFGHRQHKHKDPRLERLFGLAQEAGVSGRYLEAAQAIENALTQIIGKNLPINIDGAIAAILCEIDFPPTLANALFYIARLTGILAHVNEERESMPPMRRIDPVNHGYSGTDARSLPIK